MKLQLSPWTSRAAALGLLALVLAAIYGLLLGPLIGRHETYQVTIHDLEERLARYRSVEADRRAVQARFDALRRRRRGVEVYLKAATLTLAGAELQERTKRVVESSGGTLVSTQTLPERTEGGLVQVSIKVRMNGDVGSLQKVFYELESGQPVLFLDNVFIRSRMVRRGRGISTASELDINFDIVGYMPAGTPA